MKSEPEDFRVEEIPSYEPSGEGTHLFVQIEKRGLNTREAMKRIAEHAGCELKTVGCAGMKDRHAITRQWLSLEHVPAQAVLDYKSDELSVLQAVPNETKLRTGHLRGNRFRIRAREVEADEADRIVKLLPRLSQGVPNYFGAQRFGHEGRNVEHARSWLIDGERAPRQGFKRKLYVSSLQSAAFNQVLARRVREDRVHTLLDGDIFQTQRRGLFQDEDEEAVQARLDAWEISPTGPMFGKDMRQATGAAAKLEDEVADAFGFGEEVYKRMGKLGRGTRRVLRIRPEDLAGELAPDGFIVSFSLPAGAYATVVMREILSWR